MSQRAIELLSRIAKGETPTTMAFDAVAALDELDPVRHPSPGRLAYVASIMLPVAPYDNCERQDREAMLQALADQQRQRQAV